MRSQPNVKLGVEVFLEKNLNLVRSKRVGLITNQTGIDSNSTSTITLFAKTPGIHLVALYGPEHGVRGDAQAGEYVPYNRDKKLDIPVFSLYGQSQKSDPDMSASLDESMRSFDTVDKGKIIEPAMLTDIDVLLFDIQDVGTRIYTYIATMAYAMQVCAENDKEFIVLDRPNPINGIDMEGPILEYPEYSTFVGLYPIPVRHGMTVGELAKLFNSNFLTKTTNLTVISMLGWKRPFWFDETALPWISPSPNMPSLETATIYPGQVFLEGTNVSEGRGTTEPFEVFGAPWIDGTKLTKVLNDLLLPGVHFREVLFTPELSKYKGQICEGARIHVTDRTRFRPFETSMHIIQNVMEMNPKYFLFHSDYFDKIMGTATVREALEEQCDAREIVSRFCSGLDVFRNLREPYLLY
jgi:uncharacterized protein YbbC (DUF1343 family)